MPSTTKTLLFGLAAAMSLRDVNAYRACSRVTETVTVTVTADGADYAKDTAVTDDDEPTATLSSSVTLSTSIAPNSTISTSISSDSSSATSTSSTASDSSTTTGSATSTSSTPTSLSTVTSSSTASSSATTSSASSATNTALLSLPTLPVPKIGIIVSSSTSTSTLATSTLSTSTLATSTSASSTSASSTSASSSTSTTASAASSSSTATNLVQNGDFEQKSADGSYDGSPAWTKRGSARVMSASADLPAASGSHFLYLPVTGYDDYSQVSQSLSGVSGNKKYSISYSLKVLSDSSNYSEGHCFVTIAIGGTAVESYALMKTPSWITHTSPKFTLGSSDKDLTVHCDCDGTSSGLDVYIDNFAVFEAAAAAST